jgi:hypothetical protein
MGAARAAPRVVFAGVSRALPSSWRPAGRQGRDRAAGRGDRSASRACARPRCGLPWPPAGSSHRRPRAPAHGRPRAPRTNTRGRPPAPPSAPAASSTPRNSPRSSPAAAAARRSGAADPRSGDGSATADADAAPPHTSPPEPHDRRHERDHDNAAPPCQASRRPPLPADEQIHPNRVGTHVRMARRRGGRHRARARPWPGAGRRVVRSTRGAPRASVVGTERVAAASVEFTDGHGDASRRPSTKSSPPASGPGSTSGSPTSTARRSAGRSPATASSTTSTERSRKTTAAATNTTTDDLSCLRGRPAAALRQRRLVSGVRVAGSRNRSGSKRIPRPRRRPAPDRCRLRGSQPGHRRRDQATRTVQRLDQSPQEGWTCTTTSSSAPALRAACSPPA